MIKLYEYMDIPSSCELGKVIFKKHFYEKANLNKSDKELFTKYIDKIIWDYCLKKDNINIEPFKNDNREYNEIEFIKVETISLEKTKRIAEIIMRTIPYPTVLIFKNQNIIQIFTAHQRTNIADNSKNIIEEYIFTSRIDLDNLDQNDQTLMKSLNIKNLSFKNFYTFYNSIIENIIDLMFLKNIQ